jgi:hypothetical protein
MPEEREKMATYSVHLPRAGKGIATALLCSFLISLYLLLCYGSVSRLLKMTGRFSGQIVRTECRL